MPPKRLVELRESILKDTDAAPVFVTAFPEFATFKNYLFDTAWEMEDWIAERPTRLVPFNGDKFMGPHS